MAGVPHYPHWRTPAEYRRRLSFDETHDGVRVRRLRHFVPSKQSALTRGAYEMTFGLHVASRRAPWRPDVVVAVTPSLAGAAAASRIARRAGVPFVMWVQDLMGPATEQSGISGGSRISALTGRLESHVLRQASSVLVLSDNFKRYVEEPRGPAERVQVMPNWTHVGHPRGERKAVRRQQGWREDEIIALHSGNMGLKQGLENIVEAARLAAAETPHVRFVLMGDGSQRGALQTLAERVPTLSFLPAADDREFPDILAAADVLLVNERASAVDMSLPSKLTSYFRAGTPVIAAIPGMGSTAREIERSGAGIVIEPEHARELLNCVISLTADSEQSGRPPPAAQRHAAMHLDAEVSLETLADVVVRSTLGVAQQSPRLSPDSACVSGIATDVDRTPNQRIS